MLEATEKYRGWNFIDLATSLPFTGKDHENSQQGKQAADTNHIFLENMPFVCNLRENEINSSV